MVPKKTICLWYDGTALAVQTAYASFVACLLVDAAAMASLVPTFWKDLAS
jgi:hypothetical protein